MIYCAMYMTRVKICPCGDCAGALIAAETRVVFRYYHGNTGDLRAVTDSIVVRNSHANQTMEYQSRRLSSVSDADMIHIAIQGKASVTHRICWSTADFSFNSLVKSDVPSTVLHVCNYVTGIFIC